MLLQRRKPPKTSSRPHLNWLFVAFFADGSVIEQTQADSSVTGKGSAFTDVLAKSAKLTHFELRNGKQVIAADLTTGNFVVNGTPLQIHDQYFEPSKHNLTLTYFRETRAERTESVDRKLLSTRHYVTRYFIGWQADDNKQTKVTLAVG